MISCCSIIDQACRLEVSASRNLSESVNSKISVSGDHDGKAGLSGKTILIAEDVWSNYLFVAILLQKRGFRVLHAENGLEAVNMVKSCIVDLVLMDIGMPVMNGLTATVEIRKFNSCIPIIALSACVFSLDCNEVIACGCNCFLSKPLNSNVLMEIIVKYL